MSNQPKLYNSIIKAGLLAGTLDITAACLSTYIRSGKTPDAVFRFVASGVFGKSAFTGGTEIIIAGLLFHYLIAFAFTITFFILYPRIKDRLLFNIALTGLIYGLVVWCIMNLIVLPLSSAPSLKPNLSQTLLGMAFLMFLIGLPVAIFAKRHYSHERVS